MDKTLKIESGLQLFSRITHRPTLDNLHPALFPNGGPQPNTTIQITGAESTGKTLLITELIARCILPQGHDDKQIPGKNSGAVLINTDHHFNLIKLIAVMESILKEFNGEQAKAIIEESLKRLTVLNCYSSEQLRLTFRNLERILTGDLSVNFLAIDGILAYYWYDRAVNGATNINAYVVGILSELRSAVKGRNLVTVFTKLESEKSLSFSIDFTVNLKRVGEDDYMMLFYGHKDKKTFNSNYVVANNGLVFVDK